jgi:hypothetical protein
MTIKTRVEDERRMRWAAALCIALLAARWILVAGIGEYGMMYDQAYRLSIGQVWYRDLLSTHPPIVAEALGSLFRLFGPSLLLFNVHLYLWWLASLFVGYLLLRRYNISGLTQSAALVTYAALSLPCLTLFHAYFQAAAVFGGLFVLCFDIGFGSNQLGMIFWAGILAGISMFARQNLGAAILGGTLFLYVLLLIRRSIDYRRAFQDLALLIGGFIVSFGTILFIFSRAASAGEALRELLLDGAKGKAGRYGLIVRLIPRVNLKATLTHRRSMEIAASVVIYLALLLWIARRRSKPHAPRTSGTWKVLAIVISLLLAVNFVTLVPLENTSHWLNSSDWPVIPMASLALVDLLNIVWLTGMAWHLIASWKSTTALSIARSVLALSVFGGAIVSDQAYSVHLAPVLVPLTIAVIGTTFPPGVIVRNLCLVTSLWAAASLFSLPASFSQLVPITGPRQFTGVVATPAYAGMVAELLNNVTPIVEGKTILWIAMYGPHSAFGGIPVPNVVPWDKTTFTSRQLKYLLGRWRANPPQYVMSGPFWGREESFTPQSEVQEWLSATFAKSWCSSLQPDLCLWKKK